MIIEIITVGPGIFLDCLQKKMDDGSGIFAGPRKNHAPKLDQHLKQKYGKHYDAYARLPVA